MGLFTLLNNSNVFFRVAFTVSSSVRPNVSATFSAVFHMSAEEQESL